MELCHDIGYRRRKHCGTSRSKRGELRQHRIATYVRNAIAAIIIITRTFLRVEKLSGLSGSSVPFHLTMYGSSGSTSGSIFSSSLLESPASISPASASSPSSLTTFSSSIVVDEGIESWSCSWVAMSRINNARYLCVGFLSRDREFILHSLLFPSRGDFSACARLFPFARCSFFADVGDRYGVWLVRLWRHQNQKKRRTRRLLETR